MAQLDGKVAVITGGASGIGEGTVRKFVDSGARVVIADVQDARAEKLAEELGPNTSFYHTDVGSEEEVRAAIAHAVQKWGRLDVMFNNAGFGGVSGSILDTDMAAYDTTMAVLLRGVVIGMKHAGRVMKEQGSGCIISTSSVAGVGIGFGPHVYSAAKAAVIHLTKSVANELGESGVRVNAICPGGIATPIFGKGMGLSAEQADLTVDLMKDPPRRRASRSGAPASRKTSRPPPPGWRATRRASSPATPSSSTAASPPAASGPSGRPPPRRGSRQFKIPGNQ